MNSKFWVQCSHPPGKLPRMKKTLTKAEKEEEKAKEEDSEVTTLTNKYNDFDEVL